MSGGFIAPSVARRPLAGGSPTSMIAAMSLDSASSQQTAPAHTPTSTTQVIGTRWAVAAGHALASEAAARVLGAGGNAIDAGVAAGITLGVVHCDMVSVAGVAPILVHVARTGEVLVQQELGETLRRMARAEAKAGGSREAGVRAARDEFYRGETAKRIAEFHRAEGGPLAASDLAEFSVEVEIALRTTFGRYEVAACGFWCQGPSLLEMLNLLDGVDLKALGHNSPAYLHRLIETIKLAFADRDAYYGDPHFVKVPADGLLSKAYAAARQRLIKERAWPQMPPAGDPDRLDAVRHLEAALPLAGGSHPAPGGSTDALDPTYV